MPEPEQPADATQPRQRTQPTQPVPPAERTKPVPPPERTQPVHPAERTQPVQPAERTQPVSPAERTQPVSPAERTQPVAPPEPTRPVRPERTVRVRPAAGAVDAEPPADPLAALVAKATSTSAICWLRYGDDADGHARSRLAWHVWHEGAALLVSGGTEQPLPGLEAAEEARVTVRSKDDGGRLVTWVARVERVRHGSAQWREAAAVLAAARLNGRTEDRLLLWAADSSITRLVPTGRVVEHPGERPHGDGAAPPPPSPATTRGPLPWVVHRRPRRAPAL